MTGDLLPTPFQQRVLSVAAHCALLLAGGRGGGKSHALILAGLQHINSFGAIARPLVVRESWQALQELQEKFYSMCLLAYGHKVSRNKAEGTITIPTGAIITFTNISDDEAVRRAQGRTYTALLGDEVGTLPPQCWKWLMMLRSNLRVPPGMRPMIVLTANPHGKSHHTLYKNFISKSPAWKPYRDPSGELFMNCPSTLEDNPHIDKAAYVRQLKAATHGDVGLAEAWIAGTWGALGGNLFSNWDAQHHIIEPPPRYLLEGAKFVVGSDWGTASPATAILLAQVRRGFRANGRTFTHGDVIALDRCSTLVTHQDLTQGDGRSPSLFAKNIRDLLERYSATDAEVYVDSARGLEGDTVLGHFQAADLDARLPDKRSRVEKWDMLRERLQRAVDAEPNAIFFTTNNPELIETIPEAPRSPLRADEVDPAWRADHFLDGLVYGLYECEGGFHQAQGKVLGGW